jgi:hypothetical protein
VIDGVPHVKNPAEPPQGRQILALEELWRRGGLDDEEVLFGLIADVVADEVGNFYVLDAQLSTVQVFAPDGALLRSLFREGEGPGEVRRPRDLVMLPDGSIGAGLEFPGKIIVVDRQGIPKPSVILGADRVQEGGMIASTAASCGGGNLTVSGVAINQGARPGVQEREYFLSRFDREGRELCRYLTTTGVYDFNDFIFSERDHIPAFWWGTAIAPDGRVYTVPDQRRYAVSVLGADGTLERVIERDFTPHTRTARESGWLRRMLENAVATMDFEVTLDLAKEDPAIALLHRALRVLDDGSLWVLPSSGFRGQPDGILATYDVFDPVGHYVRQVSVACDGDGEHDMLFFPSADRALLIKGYLEGLAAMYGRGTPVTEEGEEAAPMQVVCYRVGNAPAITGK